MGQQLCRGTNGCVVVYQSGAVKALRDKARMLRELTGTSDHGARLRLERECTRALERGVEDGVRRSYRCGD